MAKILLVEDNEQNRDMLCRRLQRKGHTVLTAGDGERAVELAKAESPDLVLMDLNLPVLDGWSATRRIKDGPATCRIPVIALTAHAMSGDRQKALSAGCDDYDTKPVELSRLLGKIEKLLGGKLCEVGARLVSPSVAEPRATQVSPLPSPAEETKTAGRILVVDDTPANRDMLMRRLGRHGFCVRSAEEGEAALRLLSKANEPFDLVLLDVMASTGSTCSRRCAAGGTRPSCR